ncbi:hypothetical protein SERLA73DRAFT_149716 [Serpula lacrymans var. lacrymans S7.3]|uniref:Uncharacterized protein n=1 Tax=Serpula lacrymans var. lacrymans (strain S7.3) TaxID=936435 RepID=F8PIM7_SERL3|nr:hypothetical protein SERLA73DRAFT_149716 [Serpula lacrymans var. lacrymans S7.3]
MLYAQSAASNVVEKVCTKRTLSQAEVEQRLQTMTKSARRQQGDLLSTAVNTWLWQAKVKQKPKPSASGKHQKSLLKPEPPRFTSAAVGHGEDWSHLNKRRQRARKLKVQRDLNWMWKLQNTRRDAALQILNSQSSIPRIGTSTDVA